MMNKKHLLLSLILFFVPSFAFAASHTYTCADFSPTTGSAVSCSSGSFTITTGGNAYLVDGTGDDNAHYALIHSHTYYLSWSGTAGSGNIGFFARGLTNSGTTVSHAGAGTVSEISFTSNTNGGTDLAGIEIISTGSPYTYSGTISTVCIDDDGTSCSGGGGGGGGVSSTSTEATSTVDQTEQNLWFAYYAFFSMVVFTMWMFKGSKSV